jgi:tetratricopeptide (TPR) repeat protein
MERKRRSLGSLTEALDQAASKSAKAQAHYDLALFHDNNSREARAIPHYESALALGVHHTVESETLAWLASSLHKTGRHAEASQRASQALGLTEDPSLKRFLSKLLRRADQALNCSDASCP